MRLVVHAYAWKPSCPLAVLEISQVSESETSITLRFISIRLSAAAGENHLKSALVLE